MNAPKVKLVARPGKEMPPVEIIAQSIAEIAQAMRAINMSRLSRRALIVLLSDHSKVARKDIELVLNNLVALDKIWLK